MSTITNNTKLRLINKSSNLGTASSDDLFMIQKNLKTFKFKYSDLVTGLPDDSTIETSSDKLRIKDSGVDSAKIANGAVNFSKMRNIGNNKLIGRTASGSGDPSEVDIITDLVSANNSNIPTGSAVQTAINNINNRSNFVTLTGGTIDLDQYSNLTVPKTYNISDFTGSGINTNNIIGIYVETYAFGSDSHVIWIKALFPDGNNYIILQSHGFNGDDDCGTGAMIYIPIEEDQTTISFYSNSYGSNSDIKRVGFSLKAISQI